MNRFPRRTTADRMAEAAYYRGQTEAATKRRMEKDAMTEIPTVSLKYCEYNKDRKVLKLASEYFGMPRTFFVVSHHTGKEVRFVTVGPEDKLFNPDQWDGEMQVYRPVGDVPGVDHMVIYHQW